MDGSVIAEDEIDGGDHAQTGPEKVGFDFLFHIEDGEGHENQQGDDFLEDFQLADRHDLVSDPVGRHLEEIFKQGDTPTDQSSYHPGPAGQIPQVTVPREGHEDVAAAKQRYGNKVMIHVSLNQQVAGLIRENVVKKQANSCAW